MLTVSNREFVLESDCAETPELLCTAETAECTCPDFCERDHDTD